MLSSSPPSTLPPQVATTNNNNTTAATTTSAVSSGSGDDQLLKFFAGKLSTLNVPTSLEATTTSEDKSNMAINKIVFADLEKEFSEIVGKLLSSEDVCKRVDLFLLDLFTSENRATHADHELYQNYIRVAYYLYLLSSKETTRNNFDLILLQHVPVCLYVYFQTKNNTKLDELQQLFLSKIESVLLLIYNNECVKRRETPDKEKTLSFIASQINGIKTRYSSNEKTNVTTTPPKDPTLSTSLLLGSSHANEDFYTGISSKTLYIRNELIKNQESISPLFFRDHENALPLASEINEKILTVVCQTFSKRLDVLPLGSIFTFMRVIQRLVSQKVPYRIPTMDQVEIIRSRNEQAKKIMEESLKVIKEDITHETNVSTSEPTTNEPTSETEIQLDIDTPTPKKDKKKKMYYHEYLTQLDLITMYAEHYGDVESTESTNEPKNARRIPLSETFINESLAVLKHTSQSLEKLSLQSAPQDLFGSKQTSSKAVIVEALYAIYLRLIYDYVDSKSLLQVQAMLKMLD